MITHTWSIEKLECTPLLESFENVVRKVFWLLTSSDGVTIVTTKGVNDLGFSPDNASFINYSTLTEGTVLGWAFNELTPEAVTGFEQAHETVIDTTPIPEAVEIPLPWATN